MPTVTINHKTIFLGLAVHFLLLIAVFDVYFSTPLDHGMVPIKSTSTPAAKRLVLFVADGLRAEAVFFGNENRIPFLKKIMTINGSWGVSHTRVPTESRPGHVALLGGIYEDPSAILKGWKSNPVTFDSIINRSTNAWCWGSPDILPVFHTKSSTHVYTYSSELQDFGSKNTTLLDLWVFDKTVNFLTKKIKACPKSCFDSTMCTEDCMHFFQQGNIFFLHLLGIDTAGHGFKPHSEEYIENIRFIDANIEKITKLFQQIFPDNLTAFLFTADHGMTDWGSHGSGSNHETHTPIIAWGAGIKVNSTRQDVNQIDLAPLMSSLIGIEFPVNSLGFIPIEYLSYNRESIREIVRNNLKQLKEIFEIKRAKIEKHALINIKYKGNQELNSDLIRGINYYHDYYKYPILFSVTIGFGLWLVYLLSVIVPDKTEFKPNRLFYYLTVLIIVLLCFKSNFNLRYYFYFLFPVVIFGQLKFKPNLEINLKQIPIYFIGLELLVYGFFNRSSYTLLLLILGLNRDYKWFILCAVMSIFPSLPVMNTKFNIWIYLMGYVCWLWIFYKIKYKFWGNFVQFVCLNLSVVYVLCLEFEIVSKDSYLKFLSLFLALIPIVIIAFSGDLIVVRLATIVLGLAPFYMLVSSNFEALFSVIYVVLLWDWLLLEIDQNKPILAYKFEPYEAKSDLGEKQFKRGFFLVTFILLGFFGTGNLASLNSFDPMWTRAFLTVFSPFKMTTIIVFKMITPFIFTCCMFRALNSIERDNVLRMFCVVLLFSDWMVVHFLFLITNEGSWLEIGTSLSHFLIMEGFVVIMLVLYGLAHVLTSFDLKRKLKL